MNRNEIIKSLTHLTEVERDLIAHRCNNCNVRIVRIDGSTQMNFTVCGAASVLGAMKADPTIERFEHDYNNVWTTVQ